MFEDNDAPRGGKTLNFAMVSAVALTLLCIVIGQSAAQFAALTAPSKVMTAEGPGKPGGPKFNAIDYGQTATIKSEGSTPSPCSR